MSQRSLFNHSLGNILFEAIRSFSLTSSRIYSILFFSLAAIGLLVLLSSHHIARPIFRIKKCVDMFAQGKDNGFINLRKHDEFKELTAFFGVSSSLFEKEKLLQSE